MKTDFGDTASWGTSETDAQSPASKDLSTGDVLPPYRIESVIGQGAEELQSSP